MFKTREELLKGIENLKPFWYIKEPFLKATLTSKTYNIIEEYHTARIQDTKYIPGYTMSCYKYETIASELIGYSQAINDYVLFKPLFSDNCFTYRLFVANNIPNFSKLFVIIDDQAKLMIQDILIKKDPYDMLIDYLQDISPDFRRMYELVTFFDEVNQI